jgi:hypothetical protein
VPLFWIVYEIDSESCVFIKEGVDSDLALADASTAGMRGKVIATHQLGTQIASRLPTEMIDRTLPRRQAELVLRRLGRGLQP